MCEDTQSTLVHGGLVFDSKSRLYRFVVSKDIIYPWRLSVAKNEPANERTAEAKSILKWLQTPILLLHNEITKMKNFDDAIAFATPFNVDHVCECVCAISIHHSMCERVCYNLYFIYSISGFFRTSMKKNLKVSILWITTFLQCDFVLLNFYIQPSCWPVQRFFDLRWNSLSLFLSVVVSPSFW